MITPKKVAVFEGNVLPLQANQPNMFSKIAIWFAVNAIFPIIVPVLFLAIVDWLETGTFPIWDLFTTLTNSGFYIFSAATLTFSLYEDYRIYEKCIKPMIQTVLVLLLITTLFMFYKIQTETQNYIDSHRLQFYLTWVATAIFAAIAKYKILSYKKLLRL